MERITLEQLLKATNGSIFKLTNMAAMRAEELNSGMKKLVEANPHDKVTTIAIKEIADGKVKLKEKKDE
ncbi:MAG TPA: DNA-directed RNA polymerase subunit omega [Candidatus Omnitrophota bacterium]|nr:DNA-directed RNA polymerase subunit omega [Candidatus Omnitrophota bacterium]HPS20581.1 DNA-directed RNA polymerase subunit omega [Candidatus Omnitrophota bacterium]